MFIGTVEWSYRSPVVGYSAPSHTELWPSHP
jgi:hypothetical protein